MATLISVLISSCKDANGSQSSTDTADIQFHVEDRNSDEKSKYIDRGLLDFTETAKKILDAVVHIKSKQTTSSGNYGSVPQELPDFFRGFFGDRFQMPENIPQQPSG